MSIQWKPEQVSTMAPDAASLKAGRKLAELRKWQNLGQSEEAVWGEIQGSGKNTYQTRIDLNGPAFKCSCPSRKFPCKHALGLAFLFAETPQGLPTGEAPKWVADWLHARADKQTKPPEPMDEATQQRRAVAQEKRAASRLEKVQAGIEELQQWLKYLMRLGLSAQAVQSYRLWDQMAARLVDAQAPGLARWVRELAVIPNSGEGWQTRLLQRLARVHLLVEAFQRRGELPPPLQADVTTLVGIPPSKQTIFSQATVQDTWWVLGRRVETGDNLRIQRTWLWGVQGRCHALLLDFAAGNQLLDTSLEAGMYLDAALVFYPGVWPIRALIKERHGVTQGDTGVPDAGFQSLSAAINSYAEVLSHYPWVEQYPMGLTGVLPTPAGQRWQLQDTQEQSVVSVSSQFTRGWNLLAVSGGQPLNLFGEWDGEAFYPLSVFSETETWVLTPPVLEQQAG
jgi:hypothetical protein